MMTNRSEKLTISKYINNCISEYILEDIFAQKKITFFGTVDEN